MAGESCAHCGKSAAIAASFPRSLARLFLMSGALLRVFVAVNDRKTGEAFSVDVPRGLRALQVFHHPYAYAA